MNVFPKWDALFALLNSRFIPRHVLSYSLEIMNVSYQYWHSRALIIINEVLAIAGLCYGIAYLVR